MGRQAWAQSGVRLAGRALPCGMGPAQAVPRCWECPCYRPRHGRLRTGQPPAPGSEPALSPLRFPPHWSQTLLGAHSSHTAWPFHGGHSLPPGPSPHCPGTRGLSRGTCSQHRTGPLTWYVSLPHSNLTWYTAPTLWRRKQAERGGWWLSHY